MSDDKKKDEKPLSDDESPETWEKFEKAVDHIVKAPPKHKDANGRGKTE